MSNANDSAGSVLDLKIPPVAQVAVIAVAMWLMARAVPAASFTVPARAFMAGLFVALGGAVAVAGVWAFRQAKTTVNPHTPHKASSVVDHGVYRISRNPMYLGLLLLLIGWACYLGNAAAALLIPAFVAYMTNFQIKVEERMLLDKFGADYRAYTSRVRRWL